MVYYRICFSIVYYVILYYLILLYHAQAARPRTRRRRVALSSSGSEGSPRTPRPRAASPSDKGATPEPPEPSPEAAAPFRRAAKAPEPEAAPGADVQDAARAEAARADAAAAWRTGGFGGRWPFWGSAAIDIESEDDAVQASAQEHAQAAGAAPQTPLRDRSLQSPQQEVKVLSEEYSTGGSPSSALRESLLARAALLKEGRQKDKHIHVL